MAAGCAKLVGRPELLHAALNLKPPGRFRVDLQCRGFGQSANPFGDGTACGKDRRCDHALTECIGVGSVRNHVSNA